MTLKDFEMHIIFIRYRSICSGFYAEAHQRLQENRHEKSPPPRVLVKFLTDTSVRQISRIARPLFNYFLCLSTRQTPLRRYDFCLRLSCMTSIRHDFTTGRTHKIRTTHVDVVSENCVRVDGRKS